MRVKYSKIYEKYQVISRDGRVLEEFKEKKDAQNCAREFEKAERENGITEFRMNHRAKKLCKQYNKFDLALIIANMERQDEDKRAS